MAIEITPQFHTGTLPMDKLGNIQNAFSLSVTLSNPTVQLIYYWDFGDGTTDSSYGLVRHLFSHPGKYAVHIRAYQQNGIFEGSDTANISINYREITPADIQSMGRVQLFLYVDSSYAVALQPFFTSPLAFGLQFLNSSLYTSSNTGTDFMTHFHNPNASGGTGYELQDVQVSGKVSADGLTITAVTATSLDTVAKGNSRSMIRYGFSEGNAKLWAVTADQIMYKVLEPDLRANLSNANYYNFWSDSVGMCTDANDPRLMISRVRTVPPASQCFIVFSKQ